MRGCIFEFGKSDRLLRHSMVCEGTGSLCWYIEATVTTLGQRPRVVL